MIKRDAAGGPKLGVALVAHDNKKADLVEWAGEHKTRLDRHTIYATGTTGRLIAQEVGLEVHRMQSGPLGGDLQIGAKIAEGVIDVLVFFWDPLEPMAHDPDVKALLRMAVVWNIPLACNRSTADFIVSSPLFETDSSRRSVTQPPQKGGATDDVSTR